MLWETHVRQQNGRHEQIVAMRRALRNGVLLALVASVLVACGTLTDEAHQELLTAALSVVNDGDPVNVDQLEGSTVTGIVHIVVEVNSKSVSEVRFHLNGDVAPLAVDVDAPFELHLDTTALSDGAHLMRALAPVGRGGSIREIARADFDVANGDSAGSPDGPVSDPDPPLDPDPDLVPDPEPIEGVRIEVGDDPVVVVGLHPAGSTFVFASGVHRLAAAITPRDGDTFVGEVGAVLNGSRLLSAFERLDGLWVVTGQSQEGVRVGECEVGSPRCRYPEDLFIDDEPLEHVDRVEDVGPGKWFFDYGNDRIFFADDPVGRKVEASVASAAIVGSADDVTIRGLTIEKFANPTRPGGVINTRVVGSPDVFGQRWVIEGNTVRLNHSVGVTAGHGARVIGNRVLRNGQMGLGGGWGFGTLVEDNEIAYNNWAGFRWHWEAGGAKWSRSDGLVVRGNHVHHNQGNGLWTDIDNINTLYEFNLSEHNGRNGIYHEVSYRATIRHNTLLNNGLERGYQEYLFVDGAGIMVAHSSDVTVYGNVVQGNWNGITVFQGDRGDGAYGPYEVRNVLVRDNDVEMRFWPGGYSARGQPEGVAGLTGLYRHGGFEGVWDDAANNRFERNRYTIVTDTTHHWAWENTPRDFGAWQALGQD